MTLKVISFQGACNVDLQIVLKITFTVCPQDIRSATSLPVFRRQMNTILFDNAYIMANYVK